MDGVRDSQCHWKQWNITILFEEAKDLPGQQINAVVLPLLNIARRTSIGELNPREPSQQQLYVGSAGTRNSFAYDKNMEILVTCAIAPDKAFAWGKQNCPFPLN